MMVGVQAHNEASRRRTQGAHKLGTRKIFSDQAGTIREAKKIRLVQFGRPIARSALRTLREPLQEFIFVHVHFLFGCTGFDFAEAQIDNTLSLVFAASGRTNRYMAHNHFPMRACDAEGKHLPRSLPLDGADSVPYWLLLAHCFLALFHGSPASFGSYRFIVSRKESPT